jgi:hypothetical protein
VKGRQFTVDIRERGSVPTKEKVYCINGTKGSTLHLIRGHKYLFNILQDPDILGNYKYEFFFTESSVGGTEEGRITNLPSGSEGQLLLNVTEDLPKSFYYGDKYHRYMGGLILVHSKEEYKELQRKKRLKKK